MPHQFENAEATKVEDETVVKDSAKEAVDRLAEDAAQKSAKAVKKYDEERKIFSI
jgi:hypothetical protein